ncbi:hypothetical protein [Actinopolymorpha alba]|uniref:hypothetical protein n=1 Tax=Actinopolymorpha alba TaxID=533267 RepID=UPI00036CFB22|nr:hypothetical protein [Actinopolymorpha alba]
MPKADRILANLPPTFLAVGDPSTLRALTDAYGGELQSAENSLVAVMRAHWLDFADAGERANVDLALIGALYGLAPRPDESVEEFRDHLRRYVTTFLDGTVTVRGLLRITAEALGLHIDDVNLDSWWNRADPVLVSTTPRGDDAASLVLGVAELERLGHGPLPAVLDGVVDLRTGVDLRERNRLWIARDGHGALPVDLTTGGDPSAMRAEEIAAAINAGLGLTDFASVVDGRIRLTTASTGPDAQITLEDGPGDAADLVLGLRARTYAGADAAPATVTGSQDLSTALDLTAERYLRIVVDGTHLAEVDCAANATHPGAVDVGEITDAINDALGSTVASDDGRFLTLTSPTPGAHGYVALLPPAAQDATRRLFGPVPQYTFGSDVRQARVTGDRDLGPGVDLRENSRLRLRLDAQPAVTVDIAGVQPEATTLTEVVAAINEGLDDAVASHDGSLLTLTSSTPGGIGRLVLEEVDGDAAEPVLGLRSRTATGVERSTASFTGLEDLSGAVDLSARHLLSLSVDGAPPVTIDLRSAAAAPSAVTVQELSDAVNAGLGATVATEDGARLILVSPTDGAGGSIVVSPLVRTDRRRFVTRATVTDDAAGTVFGFTTGGATGAPSTAARILGHTDLSAGADLTVNRYLRIGLGAAEPVEVDCAGPRPRATTPAEIVEAVNTTLGVPIALTDGRTISLVSPAAGADSVIALEPPRSRDALDRALGVAPQTVTGAAAGGVRLVGLVDLSAGASVPADAALRLGVDGAALVDVPIGEGTATSTRGLSQLAALVNQTLGAQVAAHDGTHLILTSPTTGAGARLDIEVPTAGSDVTAALLGVPAPRTYQGRAATAAELTGTVDLTAGADLSTADQLTVVVDAGVPVTVDLTRSAATRSAVTAGEIAAAVNAATTATAATAVIPGGLSVRITSATTGPGSSVEVRRTGAGDAAPLFFGVAGITATGTAPTHATLDGTADLLQPVDLGTRSVLRLSVDGGPPFDVDVSGVTPSATLLEEIVAAIDDALPGVARVGPDHRIRLVSPTEGPDSSVEVLPLRFLELVEYPAVPASVTAPVGHGSVTTFTNDGAAGVPGRIEISTVGGVASPRIAHPAAGWSLRVREAVGAGGSLTIELGPDGVPVVTVTENGATRTVPRDRIETAGTGVLVVRRGTNAWSFSECRAARFDSVVLDADRFAGGPCREDAVFDLSRFGPAVDGADAVFADGPHEATAELTARWDEHAAGALTVNLPAELDPRFGAAFGEGRFGSGEPERISQVVTEPIGDPDYLVRRINTESKLVEAISQPVPAVPIGWEPVALPFRDPVRLSGGRPGVAARMYLSEPGLSPGFLELHAAEEGAFGNDIELTGRASGPAIYDLEISYPGGRFESARQTVFGPPLPTRADDLLHPGPVGVGTAKAAGTHADVTRDQAEGTTP